MFCQEMSDQDLLEHSTNSGTTAKDYFNVFLGTLPEINRRKLFLKLGCASIVEYGEKIGGATRATILRVLRIDRRLRGMPILRDLFERGVVRWRKMEKVARVATKEKEAEWADLVQKLATGPLEQFIRDWMTQQESEELAAVDASSEADGRVLAGLYDPDSFGMAGDPVRKIPVRNLEAELFLQAVTHLRKQTGKPLSYSQVLRMLVEGFQYGSLKPLPYREIVVRREGEAGGTVRTRYGKVRVEEEELRERGPAEETVDLEEERQACKSSLASEPQAHYRCDETGRWTILRTKASRYIPKAVIRYINHRCSGFCAFPGCNRPAKYLHHVRRFALNPSHDPDGIVPLCYHHERIVHFGLVANEWEPAHRWRVRLQPVSRTPDEEDRNRIDRKVEQYRRARRCDLHSKDVDKVSKQGGVRPLGRGEAEASKTTENRGRGSPAD